jgi:hypothetical protein
MFYFLQVSILLCSGTLSRTLLFAIMARNRHVPTAGTRRFLLISINLAYRVKARVFWLAPLRSSRASALTCLRCGLALSTTRWRRSSAAQNDLYEFNGYRHRRWRKATHHVNFEYLQSRCNINHGVLSELLCAN